MIHTGATQSGRNSTVVGQTAKNPPTRGSASGHGAQLPAGATPSLFLKKPSMLSGLRDPKGYQEQLAAFKQQRPEKHYQRLRNELRQEVPDPKTIKQAFKKLSTCGNQSAVSYAPAVPPGSEGRRAAVADCQRLREGIDKALIYFLPGSHTALYLQRLKVQLGHQVVRITEVITREDQRNETCSRMLADLERKKGGQVSKMSNEGTEGVVFLGTRLRRDTFALAPARQAPKSSAATDSAEDSFSESVVEKPSSASEDCKAPATVPPSPRHEANGPQPGFVGAQPKKKAVEYQTVLKSVSDPNAASGAMQIHNTVDHVQRCAGEGLPFDVGCHVLVTPDEQLRSHLSQRLLRTETHTNRREHLDRQQAALQEQSVLLQEFLPGAVVSDLPLEDRQAMVSDPDTCRKTGASLVTGPLVGLTDHLALNGMGYTNWTNVMSPDGKQFDMIDLTPQNKDIAKGAKTSLKQLVHDLKQLARHVGPDGALPSDWLTHMESSIIDFWRMTYTAEGGLFSLEDFKSPNEQKTEKELREALAALPQEASLIERNFLKAQIKAIGATANQRATQALRPICQQAAPNLLAGLVDGLKWVKRNASTLLEAHTAAAGDHGAQPGLNAKDIRQITDILADLTPSEQRKLTSLKPPLPVEASLLKA